MDFKLVLADRFRAIGTSSKLTTLIVQTDSRFPIYLHITYKLARLLFPLHINDMEDIDGQPLPFLGRIVEYQEGISYELLKPLTNFKSCHDGTPAEARILFTCRRLSPPSTSAQANNSEEYIMKIKVQIPTTSKPNVPPHLGPSDTTSHELQALQIFRDAQTPYAPHLVAFMQTTQPENGKVPGGYITYTVMTKMPGQTLYPGLGYWNLEPGERQEIVSAFLPALRAIYALGVEPIDRGLRNVLWERESKTCTIIDFELWNETKEGVLDEKIELQRWGLERKPVARNHWEEWKTHFR